MKQSCRGTTPPVKPVRTMLPGGSCTDGRRWRPAPDGVQKLCAGLLAPAPTPVLHHLSRTCPRLLTYRDTCTYTPTSSFPKQSSQLLTRCLLLRHSPAMSLPLRTGAATSPGTQDFRLEPAALGTAPRLTKGASLSDCASPPTGRRLLSGAHAAAYPILSLP